MLRLPHHFYTDKIATGGNAQISISSPLLDLQHGHTVVMLRLPNQLQNGHHTGVNAQFASPLLDLHKIATSGNAQIEISSVSGHGERVLESW